MFCEFLYIYLNHIPSIVYVGICASFICDTFINYFNIDSYRHWRVFIWIIYVIHTKIIISGSNFFHFVAAALLNFFRWIKDSDSLLFFITRLAFSCVFFFLFFYLCQQKGPKEWSPQPLCFSIFKCLNMFDHRQFLRKTCFPSYHNRKC